MKTPSNSTIHFVYPLIILLVITLSCNMPQANTTETRDNGSLVQDYQPSTDPNSIPEYFLSDEQKYIILDHGYPDRFVILFYEEILLNNSRLTFRQESWFYDLLGTEIVFRNGEIFSEIRGKPIVAVELGKTAYRPELFLAGMSLDEMLVATGEPGYYQDSVDSTLLKNGSLVYVQGLTAGFEDGRLKYVEAIPLGAAGDPTHHPPVNFSPIEEGNTSTLAETPDGGTIIIVADKTGNREIYSIDFDTGIVENLTKHPALDFAASCSPEGNQIAFSSDRTGNEEIFLMNADGEHLEQVTNNGTKFKGQIVWLSNHELLYWDGSGDQASWFKIDINAREPQRISMKEGEAHYPETIISPDGTIELDSVKISEDDWDIFDITNSKNINLTQNPDANDWLPIWAPDSQEFMFISNRDGDYEIYRMDREGNILEQFTENSWYDRAYCWLP